MTKNLLTGTLIQPQHKQTNKFPCTGKENCSCTNLDKAGTFVYHCVGGKAALGFGPDRIRNLVSMATESSHRVIMEKTVSPLFLGCFSSDPFHTCRQ